MNESNNEVQKEHETTRALQSVAEDMDRERAKNGRADSDPRGESEGRDVDASANDRGPAVPAVTGLGGLAVPDALRPVPVQAREPH
jgi:hypothetical protein